MSRTSANLDTFTQVKTLTKALQGLALSALLFMGKTHASEHAKQVHYIEPVMMGIVAGNIDIGTLAFGYERKLGAGPLSLLVNLHGGYFESDYDYEAEKEYAFGLGLGLRRYFTTAFSGSYITGQSDYIQGYQRQPEYNWNPVTNVGATENVVSHPMLSVTQVSIGYKWQWKYLALDLSIGGAFYLNDDEAYTMLIAGVNVGAPF